MGCAETYAQQDETNQPKVLLAMALGLEGCCTCDFVFNMVFSRSDVNPSLRQLLAEATRRFYSISPETRRTQARPTSGFSKSQLIRWLESHPVKEQPCVDFISQRLEEDIFGSDRSRSHENDEEENPPAADCSEEGRPRKTDSSCPERLSNATPEHTNVATVLVVEKGAACDGQRYHSSSFYKQPYVDQSVPEKQNSSQMRICDENHTVKESTHHKTSQSIPSKSGKKPSLAVENNKGWKAVSELVRLELNRSA